MRTVPVAVLHPFSPHVQMRRASSTYTQTTLEKVAFRFLYIYKYWHTSTGMHVQHIPRYQILTYVRTAIRINMIQ